MKLLEFVQEGVFDKVKAEPTRLRLKDVTQTSLRALSDAAFEEYLEYFRPRRDRIWTSMNEIRDKIRFVPKEFPNDFTKVKGGKGFVIDPHSEYEDRYIRIGSEGERSLDRLAGEDKIYSQKYEEYLKISGILLDEKRYRETERKREGRKKAEGDWPTYQQKHPENTPSTIPPKIARTSGIKPSLANPYFGRKHCALKRQYAGHPAHYPNWSNDWKRRIMAMDKLLTKNGKQGLEMMYAGTFENEGNRFNFMIIGASGNFLWRKYDPSPGAGQNHVYLNGKKMKTSDLEHMMTGTGKFADDVIKTL